MIRGRVTTGDGTMGLIGVRVSRYDRPNEGYTLTQNDGWFDFMVNGGGAVTLQFGKEPFMPVQRSIFVPWNEVSFFALYFVHHSYLFLPFLR